ncbi:hypothetical protein D3C72_1769410 [compost metagenome]
MGAGQGGMPAQWHLGQRGKPADMPGGALPQQKSGFRQIVLGGDLLHQRIAEPTVQAIDHGRIAGERAIGEGVDLVKVELHGGQSSRQ